MTLFMKFPSSPREEYRATMEPFISYLTETLLFNQFSSNCVYNKKINENEKAMSFGEFFDDQTELNQDFRTLNESQN